MKIKQDCISINNPIEWKNALKDIKHTFGHTWENCYAMYLNTGYRTYLYRLMLDGKKIVCPFVERDFEGYIDIAKPFGFSGFIGNFVNQNFGKNIWNKFAESKNYICGYLGINPIFDISECFEGNILHQTNHIYVMDLSPDIDLLFSRLSKNRKRQLKNWDKINEKLIHDKAELKRFFINHYIDFYKSKKAEAFYFFKRESLMFLFEQSNVLLVGARNNKKLVDVAVFTYTPYVAEYLFNIPISEGRQHAASLVWYAVNYFKSIGIPLLNLGGGSYEFKRRFGVESRPLKYIKNIYNWEIYKKLCSKYGLDPNDFSGYFPAYRKLNN